MKYWLVIDSWNLMESFITESISPYSFYQKRNFGNNLSRFFKKGSERFNHLVLSARRPSGDYIIELSDNLLDKTALENSENKKTVFIYPKTIYYKNGSVNFYFSSEDKLKSFIAESKILLEVKCIDKYYTSFHYDKKERKLKIKEGSDAIFSFNSQQDLEMLFDQSYNFIKGAIIGYARGQITLMDIGRQELLIDITDLKNSFAGLNTELMMGESAISDMSIKQKIVRCKFDYKKENLETTNLFDILNQIFSEVINLASKRSLELKRQKTPAYTIELEELKNKQEKCHSMMHKLELEYHISSVINELSVIRKREVDNGKNNGKKRVYFKKDTPEYKRKVELKKILSDFEENNKEYKELRNEVKDLEESIANYKYGFTDYDSTLGALFIQLSDITNELMKKVSKENILHSIDLSNVQTVDKNKLHITSQKDNEEEVCYFNTVLHYILEHSMSGSRLVSETALLDLILETAKIFKKNEIARTDIGQQILTTLGQYWRYKKQEADSFSIPDNLPILQAIMSFYIKAQGFEQIERFMLNRKYQYKEYAFMLWGAYIGFAAIPKTFTNAIYQNGDVNKELDNFLLSLF